MFSVYSEFVLVLSDVWIILSDVEWIGVIFFYDFEWIVPPNGERDQRFLAGDDPISGDDQRGGDARRRRSGYSKKFFGFLDATFS